ncbi:acetoacetate decarboxylase family protein [Lacibacter sp. MH-610]|uniref:acetoacetate decarboxylase family protein n=1 Tax=Lacibacter sp. MH-610 TaxID=3020883 RepID=UPI003892BCEC
MALNSNQQFFNEPQRDVSISAGVTKLPCFFKKVHYTVCLFAASNEALMNRLLGTGLVPALKWGRSYVVAIGLVQYEESDLGSYNEVIVAIPSLPEGMKKPFSSWLDLIGSLENRKVGQHIIQIPVTSEFSRAAGNELWGYPKIVAPVEHDFKSASLHSKVVDPLSNELIMEVKGELGFGIPSIPLSLITYSFMNERLVRTKVKVSGMMKLRLNHGLRLRVGNSKHPMANDLRMLGLDGKKPFLVMDTDKFQSVFHEALPV